MAFGHGGAMKALALTKALLAVFVILMLSACGYYNPYVTGNDGKPVLLYRTMWLNRTGEMGLENIFFQAQSDWLRKSRLITLADSATGVDYELSGSLERVDYPEVAFGQYQMATQGRVELTVSYTLIDRKSGNPLWNRSATRTQTFLMSQDPMVNQANRKAAFQQIADLFGQEIYLYMINTIIRPGTPPPVEEINQDIIQN